MILTSFLGLAQQLVPCSTVVDYYDYHYDFSGTFESIDNGQSGQVTFDKYFHNLNCFVDIGPSCNEDGLEVEITHMELEVLTSYNYDTYIYEYEFCADTIHFEWINEDGETVEKTDPQCGCLGEDHPSCDNHKFPYGSNIAVTEQSTQYTLVGTDVKLVVQSDHETDGGKIEVNWKCVTPITSTTPIGRS